MHLAIKNMENKVEESLRKQSKKKENRREYKNIRVASKKFNIQKATFQGKKEEMERRRSSKNNSRQFPRTKDVAFRLKGY